MQVQRHVPDAERCALKWCYCLIDILNPAFARRAFVCELPWRYFLIDILNPTFTHTWGWKGGRGRGAGASVVIVRLSEYPPFAAGSSLRAVATTAPLRLPPSCKACGPWGRGARGAAMRVIASLP